MLLVGPGLGLQAASASSTKLPQISLDSTLKIHPLLQYGAQTEPTKVVRVIVQATSSSALVASLLGGVLRGASEVFVVIPAVVMSVPQGSIPTLAKDPSVRSGNGR